MIKKLLGTRIGMKLILITAFAFFIVAVAAPKAHALIDLLWWLRK